MQKLSLTILLTIAVLSGSHVIMAEDAPGYTDGPFLPNSQWQLRNVNDLEKLSFPVPHSVPPQPRNSQWRVHDQARPQPPKVKPGTGDLGVTAPEDAIVLFDGSNLNAWQRTDGQAIGDGIADGAFDIMKTGQLRTKEEFGSCQLHIEWVTPIGPEDRMNWGNSGVFPMGLFEIQVIESCDSFIYADGNAGAIYGQFPPLVNPARKPGEWQSFDIFFTAPKFDGDKMLAPAYVTIIYNGVLVQNHQEIIGTVSHRALPGPYPVQTQGPLMLQDHHSGVKFRNIWIRPIKDAE